MTDLTITPERSSAMSAAENNQAAWQPIETAPKDGSCVALRRQDCPGYDTYGTWTGKGWDTAAFFIRSDWRLFYQPSHWRPMNGDPNGTFPDPEGGAT